MTSLIKVDAKIRRASHRRPKSLILSINPTIRDIMEFEHETPITMEVCVENEEKYVKLYKKTD